MFYDPSVSFLHDSIAVPDLAHCKHPIHITILTLGQISIHHALLLLLGH